MITNIAIAIAVLISATGLFYSGSAFRLQRRTLKANLFYDISQRIRELEDQWPKCKELEEKKQWYERLFNAFEYFAFFANRKELTSSMKEYYKDGIKTYVERIKWEQYSGLLEEYKKRSPGKFNELRRYYKNAFKEELPF